MTNAKLRVYLKQHGMLLTNTVLLTMSMSFEHTSPGVFILEILT